MVAARIGALAFAIMACAGFAQDAPDKVLLMSVTDLTGASVAAANVDAIDEKTGTKYHAFTDSAGSARMQLPAGTYTLRVHAMGFEMWMERSIEVKSSMSRAVCLNVAGAGSGPVIAVFLDLQVQGQTLDADISPIPLELLDLPAKPIRHKVHRLTPPA